jgi:hypothetical protein
MQLLERDNMLNTANYVKITALTGFRAKLGGNNKEDDILTLLRILKYTAYVAGVQDEMRGLGAEAGEQLSEDIRQAILNELDLVLTAEGF